MMYRALFETSREVIECDSLKQLVDAVMHDLRWSLTHMAIPKDIEPFETVRLSKRNGHYGTYIASMYAVNNNLYPYSVQMVRVEPQVNVQTLWQRKEERGRMTNEEAIKWLENLINDIGHPQHQDLWGYHQALDEIKDILKQMQWIPCSERLPENPKNPIDIKEYLTCDKDGDINKLMWGGGWNCVLYPDGSCCRDYEIKDIVAWMFLPEAYKEEA